MVAKEFGYSSDGIRDIAKKYNIPVKNYSVEEKKIKVVCLDKDNLKEIKTFSSYSEAIEWAAPGKNARASRIGEVCQGKRKTAYGYK